MIAKSNGLGKRPPPTNGFKKGKSGNPTGRAKGVPIRRTAALKDAILLAATNVGDEIALEFIRVAEERDGEVIEAATVEGGLIGYLMHLARRYPQTFAGLLGRVLPLVVQGGEKPITVEMQERAERFTRALKQLSDRADRARS